MVHQVNLFALRLSIDPCLVALLLGWHDEEASSPTLDTFLGKQSGSVFVEAAASTVCALNVNHFASGARVSLSAVDAASKLAVGP